MSGSNKRIVKNTMLLYFRMLLIMGVSFYTVRLVLQTLGVEDYGIYNLVGGVVAMMSFLNNAMASALQRFFSYEIGKNNYIQLRKTFGMTIIIFLILIVFVFVLAETIGLWFLNNKLIIPENRIEAANWVFQFSIFSFLMTLFTVPYNAAIIAREKMGVYAFVSIIEVILKLALVYLLVVFSIDKLKLYSLLLFVVTVIVTLIYRTYCQVKLKECRIIFFWDASLFKKIISFSGWNLFESMSNVFSNQGVNVILGLFFSPVVNAARGIAFQVSVTMNQFVLNFMTATRPQIIKRYVAKEQDSMLDLVFRSSKFSFFLLFLVSTPLMFETDFLFRIWLGAVPEYVVVFTRLVIISILIDVISYPLMTTVHAVGKVKVISLIIGIITLCNLPLSYFFLYMGYAPQSVFYIKIVITVVCVIVRLGFLKRLLDFPVFRFVKSVVFPLTLTMSATYIILGCLQRLEVNALILLILSVLFSIFIAFIVGCSTLERLYLMNFLSERLKGIKRKK